MARAPAWIAHALEQARSGRMIRPASTYVGPMPAAAGLLKPLSLGCIAIRRSGLSRATAAR